MSAAFAVNSKGAFWFATYEGGLSGELFVTRLKKMMFNRKKAVHLIITDCPRAQESRRQGLRRRHPGQTHLALPGRLRAGPQSG
jgi:hypothetical protein